MIRTRGAGAEAGRRFIPRLSKKGSWRCRCASNDPYELAFRMQPGCHPDVAPPAKREPPPCTGHLTDLSGRLYPSWLTGETWQADRLSRLTEKPRRHLDRRLPSLM